jgi:small subunit ribosomal protein S17
MAIKEKIGTVISDKMEKTIVIKVENYDSHSAYSKIITKTKKYLVHDTHEIANIGDKVVIKECRPLSKRKRWILERIISKSSLIK